MKRKTISLMISALVIAASFGVTSCSSATNNTTSATNMTLITTKAGNNGETIKALAINGNYLYAAGGYDGMLQFGISDISNISIIGTNYYTPTDFPVNDVFVLDGFAFLALGNYNGTGGLAVMNISSATVKLTVASNTFANADSRALYVTGTAPNKFTVYVADENLGLAEYAVDTTGGSESIALTRNTVISNAQPVDIAVNGTTAYLAAKTGGVIVMTGIGTAGVKIAAQISTEISDARGVALAGSGNTLFVADRMLGIWSYDVTTPANPTYKGSYPTAGEANALIANGDDVYVADGSNGVLWLDFTVNTSPVLKKETGALSGMAWNIALSGNYILSAYGTEGVKVFEK